MCIHMLKDTFLCEIQVSRTNDKVAVDINIRKLVLETCVDSADVITLCYVIVM